ncbi:MAG: hypothetical protein ACXWUE_26640 [Polyangiales bacterium]
MGALALGVSASSCGGTRDSRTNGPFYVAITDKTPAALMGDQGGVYQVRRSIPIPLGEKPDIPGLKPYPGGVWYTPADLRVQMSYVITNMEDKDVTVELLVDGWNEFIWYSPQVKLDDEGQVQADRSCVDRHIIIPAKSRAEGRVSFDDFERMAQALAAIENKAPNPFHVVEPSTSFDDPLIKPYMPEVIDGITGFDLSLRATEPVRVVVEATLELVDLKGVLVEEGTDSKNRRSSKKELQPVVAAPAM